jgi:hypothetical protein
MTLDEKIAQAQCHVDRGRIIIEGQRAIVAAMDGRPQPRIEMDLAELLKRR